MHIHAKVKKNGGVEMKFRRLSIFAFMFSLIFAFNSGFLVIGHRGNPEKYPEETIQSDNSAFGDGADYVELDVHVSKDNVLVISHDPDLERTVGSPVIVSQNNFSYLKTLHQANGEPIISLDELFAYYQNKPHTKFLLETKNDQDFYPENTEELLASSIKKYHMQNRVMVHSFYATSLKRMAKLLPKVPRYFLVGSLKRINFDILRYVDGINISNDLIYKSPALISQLHTLNKKVLVWARMDESPQLWQWLVNNHIDGMVTNFPAVGYKYKLAKKGSHKEDVNQTGTYLGRIPVQVTQNPYVLSDKANKKVYFLDKVKVSQAVLANDKIYYHIGKRQYIPAELVSLDLDPNWLVPYWNLKLQAKNSYTPTYQEASQNTLSKGKLLAHTKYKILGINGGVKDPWFLTKAGWVKASDTLLYGMFDNQSVAASYYQAQKNSNRLTNVNLLKFQILQKIKKDSFWSPYQATNAVIFNQVQK